ncbi:uncharacterized protein LOC133128217 [Conger conger]|uniref:uncharacterized protein LOC133128217 n=1 Tax=Conger conger TaxID=82655 RepID=UPI002A5A854D|nr:uncharacterized protein LOC133128217 [Conger conger]
MLQVNPDPSPGHASPPPSAHGRPPGQVVQRPAGFPRRGNRGNLGEGQRVSAPVRIKHAPLRVRAALSALAGDPRCVINRARSLSIVPPSPRRPRLSPPRVAVKPRPRRRGNGPGSAADNECDGKSRNYRRVSVCFYSRGRVVQGGRWGCYREAAGAVTGRPLGLLCAGARDTPAVAAGPLARLLFPGAARQHSLQRGIVRQSVPDPSLPWPVSPARLPCPSPPVPPQLSPRPAPSLPWPVSPARLPPSHPSSPPVLPRLSPGPSPLPVSPGRLPPSHPSSPPVLPRLSPGPSPLARLPCPSPLACLPWPVSPGLSFPCPSPLARLPWPVSPLPVSPGLSLPCPSPLACLSPARLPWPVSPGLSPPVLPQLVPPSSPPVPPQLVPPQLSPRMEVAPLQSQQSVAGRSQPSPSPPPALPPGLPPPLSPPPPNRSPPLRSRQSWGTLRCTLISFPTSSKIGGGAVDANPGTVHSSGTTGSDHGASDKPAKHQRR